MNVGIAVPGTITLWVTDGPNSAAKNDHTKEKRNTARDRIKDDPGPPSSVSSSATDNSEHRDEITHMASPVLGFPLLSDELGGGLLSVVFLFGEELVAFHDVSPAMRNAGGDWLDVLLRTSYTAR
jgi:hypothetical protein